MSDIVFEYVYDGDDARLVQAIADGRVFVCDGLPVHLPGAVVTGSTLVVPLPTRLLEVDLTHAKVVSDHRSKVHLRLHFRR